MAAWALLQLGVPMPAAAVQEPSTGDIAGRVFGPDGVGLAGATVGVVGLETRAVSGGDGEYSLVGIPPGTYTVRFSAETLQLTRVHNVIVEAGDVTEVDVVLEPAVREVYQPAPVTGAPPTALLRRLAEAVDGYRLDRDLWVVAYTTFPHAVVGVFDDATTAESVAADNPDAALHGPFRGGSDIVDPYALPLRRDPLLLYPYPLGPNGECPPPLHRRPSLCINADSLPAYTVPIDDVDSLRVSVFHGDSLFTVHTFAPLDVDALFFSMSAIDKFYIPYMTQVFGVHYAVEFREVLERWIRRVETPPR